MEDKSKEVFEAGRKALIEQEYPIRKGVKNDHLFTLGWLIEAMRQSAAESE